MEPTLLSVLSLLAIFLNEAGGNNDTTNVMKIRSRHGKSADADNFLESSGKTKREFFPPDLGVIVAAVETLPNSRCRNDSRAVLEAVARHEKWGMQIYDASPKFPMGLLYGMHYQLGNFDECVNTHRHRVDGTIRGQYCLANISLAHHHGENVAPKRGTYSNVLQWAICVPSSCQAEDVENFLETLFRMATRYDTLNVTVPALACHYEKDVPFTALEIFYGSFLGVFIIFVLLATTYHSLRIYRKSQGYKYTVDYRKSQRVNEILVSFSLVHSVRKLLHVQSSELGLECINGMKFLSMVFIIASHCIIFLISGPVVNTSYYEESFTRIQNSLLTNSALLVDTFLLISGFLMCRLLLLELDKRNGKINVLYLYIMRYIRLTPSYLVVILFHMTLLWRMQSGPLWDSRIITEKKRCLESWWSNLFYVNNYVNTDNICMFQAWYLSVDTQLFVIAPLIIFPLWKWKKFGELLLGSATILSIAIPFAVTYRDKIDPTLLPYPTEMLDMTKNPYYISAYIKTHMRAIPYFIGLLCGYVVHRIQISNVKLPFFVVWIGWTLSLVCGLASMSSIVIFLYPEHDHSALESALYASIHKVAWAYSMAWIILACVTDNASIVKRFLSWNLFVPLSRLTYCAYLINDVVELNIYGTVHSPIYLSVTNLTFNAWGHVVVTFMAGSVLCLLFESPIHSLEKILLRGVTRKQLSENGRSSSKVTG